MKKMSKTQRRNQRRRARAEERARQEAEDEEGEPTELIGTRVITKSGRTGVMTQFDPDDRLLELKIELDDNLRLNKYSLLTICT